jgi:hypothetical protein
MDWDAIGAMGEVLGAFAVVVTLLYLARETRKNAQAIDATSTREAANQLSEWHREAARDPELKRIVMRSISLDTAEYSPEEWWEFRAVAISLFMLYQSQFIHGTLAVGNGGVPERGWLGPGANRHLPGVATVLG